MTKPTQYFAPSSGQRSYTLANVLSSITDQVGTLADAQAGAELGEVVNVYASSATDELTTNDKVTCVSASPTTSQTWNAGSAYGLATTVASGIWSSQ